MGDRIDFRDYLVSKVNPPNIYCKPPVNSSMHYPAIKYKRIDIKNKHANNEVYSTNFVYEVIVIYSDPDEDLTLRVAKLPKTRFVRTYVADNLYHDVYNINF